MTTGTKFAKPTSIAQNSTGEHSIPAKLLPQDFDSEISAVCHITTFMTDMRIDLIQIIDEITCVIQARISNRYDGVRDSVRNARQQLLSQAANDLRSLNELKYVSLYLRTSRQLSAVNCALIPFIALQPSTIS